MSTALEQLRQFWDQRYAAPGFDVTPVDVSPQGVDKARRLAAQRSLHTGQGAVTQLVVRNTAKTPA